MDSHKAVYDFLVDCKKSRRHSEIRTKVDVKYDGDYNSYTTNIIFSEDVFGFSVGIDDMKAYNFYRYELFKTQYQNMEYIENEYLKITDDTTGVEIKIYMPKK